MKKGFVLLGISMVFVLMIHTVSAVSGQQEKSPDFEGEGFITLFNNEDLDGWRKLTEYSGDWGQWTVEDGVLVGTQYPEGKGGLLVTEKKYKDFILYAEVKADYPVDSGLFLRVQPSVLSYQITIDYRPDGEVGAVYCPLGGDFLLHNPEVKEQWKQDDFNQILVSIKGQPPLINVSLNGKEVVAFKDEMKDGKYRVPEEGFIGVQVHPGESWGKGNHIYFRKIMVKPIDEIATLPNGRSQ
jgi:hypothetical protein